MEENTNEQIIPGKIIDDAETGDTISPEQIDVQSSTVYIVSQLIEYFGTNDINVIPTNNDIWLPSIPEDFSYVWSRTTNTYNNNTISYSNPILIEQKDRNQHIILPSQNPLPTSEQIDLIDHTEEMLTLEQEFDLVDVEEFDEIVEQPQDYESDSSYLNQTAIFNLLTENGAKEGIFFYEKDAQGNPVVDGDGTPHLYINMSYARSGVLQVGGNNNNLGVFMVLDENDHIVGQWDKNGIALQGGVIQSKDNSSWWNLTTGTLNLNGYITSYTKKYAIGTSQTTHPTEGWNTNPPDSVPEGSYLWQEATLKKTGSPDEVTYVCLGKTGKDGTNGINGRDIVSINTQYRLSSSDVQLVGGSWSNAAPAYEKNKYYWTRVKVVYNDGNTEYNPDENGVVDLGLTTANRIADDAKEISNLAKSSADSAVADAQIAKQQATAAATSASNAATSAANAQSSASSAATSASSAATSASNAATSASSAATSASNAQSSASSAATSASNAQASALAAAESASDAQTKASDAQSFASNAAQSAYDANLLASDAATSAQNANNSASTAAQNASNAAASASDAADSASSASTAASNAQTLAGQAKTQAESAVSSANEAKTQAGQATTAANEAKTQAGQATSAAQVANQVANGAINSLSTVEDVMGTLTWIQQHGTYALTTDTTIEPGKHYFTRSGTSPNYTYSLVQNPTGNPSTNGYYELTGTDEAVSNYVSTHLALTDQGLFISTDGVDSQGQGTGYKLLLTGNNAQIIDNTGVVVSTYGQNITFNSYRPQRIGGDNVYLEYYDSNSDGRADAIRIQGDKVDIIGGHSIQSSNYQTSGNANSPYTSAGTYLDLTNGNFYTPNFGINSSSAYLNGEITAKSGRIGQSNANSYWKIGSIMDYNQQTSASLEAEGTAYIQIGNFQFSEGLLNTQKYTANRTITYLKQGSTYWDFGVQAPELDTTKTGYVAGVDDNFLYIRNHENTIPTLKTDWNYVFRVDKTGMVYINGVSLDNRYALKTDVGSTYLPVTGGTINGNLTVTGSINGTATKATQLSTARTLIADLSSITAGSFDGTSNVTLGISGTLGIGHGGTGKTYWTQYGIVYASTTSALSQLAVGTSGQVLTSGGNAAPGWTNQSSLAAGTATKWASPQKVYVTLGTASTTTAIQGGSSTAQTIGVDGTLAVGHGGTGATTFTSGAALIGNGTGAIQTRAIRNNTTQGALGWTSSSTDTTLITTNTLAYWNGAYQNTTSNLEYVKLGKLGTVVTHNIDEFITTAGGIIDGSLSVTDLTAGNLIVNGVGRFTNGLYGDLTGNADTASRLNISSTDNAIARFNGTNGAIQNSGVTIDDNGSLHVSGEGIYFVGANNLTAAFKLTTSSTPKDNIDFGWEWSSVSGAGAFFHSSANPSTPGIFGFFARTTVNGTAVYTQLMGTPGTANNAGVLTWGDRKVVTGSSVGSVTVPVYIDADGKAQSITSYGGNAATATKATQDGSGNNIVNTYATKTKALQIYSRSEIGTSPNYDNPGVNGLFEIRSSSEVTGETGTRPFTGYAPFLSIKSENVMLQLAGTSGNGLYWRGKQAANVTMSGTAWIKLIDSSNYTDYTVTKTGTGASGSWGISITGTATSAGKISATRAFTVGKTTKNVDWSAAVSFSQADIADIATNTADGWMSAADKEKLDKITISDIGSIGANSIVGEKDIKVTISSGIATIGHANAAVTAGTAGGTAHGTTLTNGGTFQIPTVTYDAYGHITAKGTSTLTLPSITSVSGNAGTATKFSSARSITLTGDTTGTASADGSSGWSIATTTNILHYHGNHDEAKSQDATGSAYDGMKYTSGMYMTGGYNYSNLPATYGNMINLAGLGSGQIYAEWTTTNNSGHLFYRSHRDGTSQTWGQWLTILDSSNYTTYTVKKDGTGASGSWGISITGSSASCTGNAATATKATQDGDSNIITSTYAKLSGATFTGAINTANNTYNKIGDDVAIGDINTAGALGVKGLNGATKIVLVPYSGSTNNIISNDGAGNLTISGTTIGTFSGSLSGNATSATSASSATKWTSAQTVYVTLGTASTTTTIQGGSSTAQTIGVNGTLGVGNGGTGKTTGVDAANYFLNSLTTGFSTPVDNDYYISQYVGGGTTTTTYHRRPMSELYAYVKGKTDTVYAKLAGAAFTGAVTGTSFAASGTLAANTANNSTAGGIALYSTTPTSYGIAMRGTGNGGKHGYVQGDWAIYNYMTGADNRGFVWRNSSTSKNVASISSVGNAAFSGSMTVGANEANTSGCRLEFDSTNSCLNFVFA